MFFNVNRALLFVSILAIFFNCGGGKTPIVEEAKHVFPERKAYVVLRSEGESQTLEKVKDILSSDFNTNNVYTTFSLYKAKQGWNQNKIFQTAYGDQYDYIILVDQIAKFTIDGRTQVGGKYQLRSYHVKSPNPDWLDLGQMTCNITVKPSIQKFSREIVRGIVGNRAEFEGHNFDYDDTALASNDSADASSGGTSNLNSEIERLKYELEAEKEKTRLAELEKRRIENQLKLQTAGQKEKARMALLEEKRLIQEKKQKEKDIARVYAAKREEIRKREAEEALKNPQVLVESEPKEPTREERLQARRDAKKKIADQKAEKRRQAEEAILKRQEDRRRLAETKRREQKQLREDLAAKRARDKRLAEQARLNKQRNDKALAAQEKESKRLLEDKRIEEQNRIELEKREAQRITEANRKEEARKKQELEALQEREKRIAKQERINKQKEAERLAAFEVKRKEEQRIAEKKRQDAVIAEQQRQAQALAEAQKIEDQREAEELVRQQKEAKRLAALEVKRKEELRIAEEQRQAALLAEQKRQDKALAEAKQLEAQRQEKELRRQQKEAARLAALEAQLVAEQQRIEQAEQTAIKKLEEDRIAEVKRSDDLRLKKRDERKRQAEEWKRQEEQEKLAVKQRKSKRKKDASNSNPSINSSGQVNALIIIRGKESDAKAFKALKDHIEFDFMFAKAKAATLIFNPAQSLSLDNVLTKLSEDHNRAIVIDQLEYLGDGKSSYQVKTLNKRSANDWHDLGIHSYNLSLKGSLKQLSKEITNSVTN